MTTKAGGLFGVGATSGTFMARADIELRVGRLETLSLFESDIFSAIDQVLVEMAVSNGTHLNSAEFEGKTILFLHIPKTAGTTLNRIMEYEYNPLRIYTVEGRYVEWSIRHFKNLARWRRASFQVVKGHLSFGLHEFVPRPATYITFLRDPVDRALSWYFYAKGNPLNPFHKRIHRENLGILEFLELTRWDNNLQCKMLAGLEREVYRPREIVEAASKIGAPPPDASVDRFSNPEILECARTNLAKSISFVGLTERFAESLGLLKHLLGWKFESFRSYRKSAAKMDRSLIDQAVVDEIDNRNALDRALYDEGKRLFELQLKNCGADIGREVAELRNDQPGPVRDVAQRCSVAVRFAASRIASLL